MRRFRTTIVLALATLLSISICSAQQTATTSVPNLIRYSGTLKDVQGAALSSSTAVGVTFSIYKQQDGGAAVWMETQNVTPDASGQYNVILGSTTATGLPDDLFSQQEQRWLGVQVQGQAEQARVLLVSVPYAFKAHEAETLGGLPASAFVQMRSAGAAGGAQADGTSVYALGNVGTASSASQGKGADGKLPPAPCNVTSATPNPVNVIPTWDLSGTCVLVSYPPSGTGVVNGNLNLSYLGNSYRIGGFTALSFGVPSSTQPTSTFVGALAGASNTTGFQNTFVGAMAGTSNTTGYRNTFVGLRAGNSNTSGQFNTFLGMHAGYNNRTGIENTFVGFLAGANGDDSYNTYLGFEAGESAHGQSNTYTGLVAGFYSQGSNNTFNGASAGVNNDANGNSFFGYNAGMGNTSGNSNSFFGSN